MAKDHSILAFRTGNKWQYYEFSMSCLSDTGTFPNGLSAAPRKH